MVRARLVGIKAKGKGMEKGEAKMGHRVTSGKGQAQEDVGSSTLKHIILLFMDWGGIIDTRAAGAVANLIAKEGKSATLRLPSGEVRLISKNCSETVR
ncbi:hypothetical protein Gohar_013958 [Gossypium harknessii]|uniref:Uncharacterized protein n=1 Tax=Gossypium harknessii TaxID=34285 RepID=A0A7J9H1R3_9ROSI|nr:hypothetical protein [Gossypium harknessii]